MRVLVLVVFVVMCLTPSAALVAQTKTSTAPPAKTPATAQTLKNSTQGNISMFSKGRERGKSKAARHDHAVQRQDAAKFWPIYRDYEIELNKLNNLRVANIHEYAHSYKEMTDEKADELIKNAMAYQRQRDELLAKYYERVKQGAGCDHGR